jgi:hypothetical protein
VLETLQSEAEEDPIRKQQLAAIRYYLQVLIDTFERRWEDVHGGVSNYVALLDQLRRVHGDEEVCIVTFNYDCMIEKALSTVGVIIHDINDYNLHPTFKLFKLHGSVNWFKHLSAPFTTVNVHRDDADLIRELIQNAANIETFDEFYMHEFCPVGKIDQTPIWPALAIPVTTKLLFECPKSHLRALERCLPETRRIVTIGWRGAEYHFVKILSQALRHREVPILPIAGTEEGAQEVLTNLQSAGIRPIVFMYPPGFSHSIVARRIESFFKPG